MYDASDAQDDGAGDGQWMTYAELGQHRGISARAAVRMTQRQRLRRQPGNDGKVRIWVPRDMLEPARRASQRPVRNDSAGDETGAVAAMQAAFQTTLAAKDEVIAAQGSLISELRVNLEDAKAAAQKAEHDRNAAQTIAEELARVAAERKARGRLRRAWDGWRGR